MPTVKLSCPRCKKKSFSKTVKEDGNLWFCYQCKYYKKTNNKKIEEKSKDDDI